MVTEKEDLELSLSLSSSNNTASNLHNNISIHRSPALQSNLIPTLLSSSSSSLSSLSLMNFPFASAAPRRKSCNNFFGSAHRTLEGPCKTVGSGAAAIALAGTANGDPCSFLRGIDVSRLPSTAAENDEAGVSSPNSTISSVSGKRSERGTIVPAGNSGGDDQDTERAWSRLISDEEDGEASRRKLRLSKDQSAILEQSFKERNTLNPGQKLALAKRLGLRTRQVEVWFQNRRARSKLKQTEAEFEFLKRYYEQLTEENRRLQKEAQELRALKLSPRLNMQMAPPITPTTCPSCDGAGALSSSSASAIASTQADARPGHGGHGAALHRRLPMNLWGVPIGHVEAIRP